MFTEARDLLKPERLEMLVALAGLWEPVVIVTELGALTAFGLARNLGHDVLR